MTKKINELPMIFPDTKENIPDISLLFIRRSGNYVSSSEEAWKAMLGFIKGQQLDKSKLRYFSISHDNPQITVEDKLRFDACIEASKGVREQGEVGRQVIKGGQYAVFTHHGPHHDLGVVFDRIFLKWLPDCEGKFDESRPVFCEHFNLEFVDNDEDKLITKIYIPIA